MAIIPHEQFEPAYHDSGYLSKSESVWPEMDMENSPPMNKLDPTETFGPKRPILGRRPKGRPIKGRPNRHIWGPLPHFKLPMGQLSVQKIPEPFSPAVLESEYPSDQYSGLAESQVNGLIQQQGIESNYKSLNGAESPSPRVLQTRDYNNMPYQKLPDQHLSFNPPFDQNENFAETAFDNSFLNYGEDGKQDTEHLSHQQYVPDYQPVGGDYISHTVCGTKKPGKSECCYDRDCKGGVVGAAACCQDEGKCQSPYMTESEEVGYCWVNKIKMSSPSRVP